MRWPVQDLYRWRTGFAWFSVEIKGQWVWLEPLEWRYFYSFGGTLKEYRLPDTAA